MNRTFVPSLSTYRTYVYSIASVVGIIFLVVVPQFWGHVLVLLLYLAIGVVVIAVLVELYFHNTRFVVEDRSLVTRTMFRHSRTFARTELDRAVLVLRYQQPSGYTSIQLTRLFVLDLSGSSVLTWVSSAWTEEQMRSLVSALGLHLDEITDAMTPAAFRRRYPRAISAFAAHPFLAGFVVAMVLLVTLVAVVVIALARS